MLDNIEWLGHASFHISGDANIYIDPWKLNRTDSADIILVSHSHYDHYSQEDIDKVRGENGVVVTVPELAGKVGGAVQEMAPGDSFEINGVRIEAIRAYNKDKKFHPKENNWLGFVITTGGQRIYYAGDTDVIPEMKVLRDIDIALLPIGGTYTMTAAEAANAANAFGPKIAVPYHWGDIIGERRDADRFEQGFMGKTVVLEVHE